MDITFPDYVSSLASDPSQADMFLFHSNFNLVRASGASQRLSLPILSPDFNQQVQQLFARAKATGVDNPMLLGAIPFDMNLPTQLVVPEWSERMKPVASRLSPFVDKEFCHHVVEACFTPSYGPFLNMIEQALDTFKNAPLRKVVLSKVLDLTLDKVVDIPRLLANIMGQNPSAYHFSVPLENGVLLGASPELLIRKQGNKIFSNPLAGSAKRLQSPAADQQAANALLGSVKDQYEHRLVVESIRSALLPLVEDMHIEPEPSLISTPTMWHLSTHIAASLAAESQVSIFDLIKNIHPTPAMCGTPTLLAKHHIDTLEPHQRGFFSGLVGWCDAQGNGEWAIAIRCAHVSDNKVTLFAGAGVVPDSSPDSEWLETSAKMRTMLNAFGIEDEVI